jgi:hypothetical protein
MLDLLTKEKTNMEWKLCSIESPKEEETVILTFKNSAGLWVGEAMFKDDGYYYIAETDNGYFEEMYGIPVAWMKKPDPYNPNINE